MKNVFLNSVKSVQAWRSLDGSARPRVFCDGVVASPRFQLSLVQSPLLKPSDRLRTPKAEERKKKKEENETGTSQQAKPIWGPP